MTEHDSPSHSKVWMVGSVVLMSVIGALVAWKPADLFYHEARMLRPSKLNAASMAQMTQEQIDTTRRQETVQRLSEAGTFAAIGAACICGGIGLATGLARGRFGRGLAGGIGGLVLGGAAGFSAGVVGKVLSDKYRIMPILTTTEKLSRIYLFQVTAFLLIALAAAVIFLIVLPDSRRWFRTIFGAAAAAALTTPIYLAATAIFSPLASTENFIPLDSICRLIWFLTPALLVSLAVSLLADSGPEPHTTTQETQN